MTQQIAWATLKSDEAFDSSKFYYMREVMQLLLIGLIALVIANPHDPPFRHKFVCLPGTQSHPFTPGDAQLPFQIHFSCQKPSFLQEDRLADKNINQLSQKISEQPLQVKNESQHQSKMIKDQLAIRLIKKCRPTQLKGRKQRTLGEIDQQQYCYVSKQEFISREQFIDTLQEEGSEPQSSGDQYVWVALLITGMIGVYLYFKMRVGLLLDVLAEVELKADMKSNEYEQRLQQLQQLKKIYEVHWDKVVYRNEVDVCYDHTVYEGRFLTQETYVYAVSLEHADVGTLQHKLGKLLNCSHRRLAKLYYYTRTPEFMLIFTQKISPLSLKNLEEHFSVQTPLTAKKNSIMDIIETLSYLQQKIELKLLPLESIQLEIISQNDGHYTNQCYDYKINTIPCLFRKMNYHCSDEDFDTASEESPICLVRLNIVSLFHLLLLDGKLFNKQQFSRLTKQGSHSNEEYIEFLDFILYEAKAIGHTHELLFKEVLEHPFLWDSKRKILFLADFSNYIETHLDEQRLFRMERYAKDYKIIKPNWIRQFHSIFASEVNFYRKYDFQSVRDLIRMIRNKLNHFHEIPKEVKSHIGKTPEGFIEYCLAIFPKLLPFAYIYTRKKKWKLHMK